MKCIGGSVDIQSGGAKKWKRRKLWLARSGGISHQSVYTVYLAMRDGRCRYLKSNGTVSGSGDYWRHIKLPEGYELYQYVQGRIVHVRDVVEATKQRLGML